MPRHSQRLYAILVTHPDGTREFATSILGIVTAPTKREAQKHLQKWREVQAIGGGRVRAKVVKAVVREA